MFSCAKRLTIALLFVVVSLTLALSEITATKQLEADKTEISARIAATEKEAARYSGGLSLHGSHHRGVVPVLLYENVCCVMDINLIHRGLSL
jgi:hypothetical protein